MEYKKGAKVLVKTGQGLYHGILTKKNLSTWGCKVIKIIECSSKDIYVDGEYGWWPERYRLLDEGPIDTYEKLEQLLDSNYEV